MPTRMSFSEIGAAQGGNFSDKKNSFLDLKPNPDQVVRVVRIIGEPVVFYEHNDKISMGKDAAGKLVTKQKDFSDKETNRRFSRICTEDDPRYGVCPWCTDGHLKTRRFAVNVLDRETGEVKVMSKGRMLFKKFDELEQINREEAAEDLAAGNTVSNWTNLGMPIAPDIRIQAKKSSTEMGGIEYLVSIKGVAKMISDAEIAILKGARTITPDDKQALIDAAPEYVLKYGEHALYGHNLDAIYKPNLRSVETSTPDEDLDFTAQPVAAGDSDESEAPTTSKARTTKPEYAPKAEAAKAPSAPEAAVAAVTASTPVTASAAEATNDDTQSTTVLPW